MGILKVMLILLLGCASISFVAMDDHHKNAQKQCSLTQYPGLCVYTLVEHGSRNQPIDFISALLNKTIFETKLPSSYFTKFSTNLEIQEVKHVNSILEYCQDLMSMSIQRLEQSLLAIKTNRRKNKEDIQTWISAAITFQQTCKDSADNVGLSMGQISKKMDYLSQLGSNPLAIVNRIPGKVKSVTADRKRDFPSWLIVRDRKLLQASTINANAVVAKDGTGNYRTISEAINAASGGRFVIYVKEGVYKEKIRANKDGITLIGDGKYSTIIVGDGSVTGGSSMPGSATFTITGDNFIARDIGFQNTAGPEGRQALALYVASDRAVFFRCSISGYQDTLYALALRQFYRECDILGTIDFIFGNAAAVFQNCYLGLRHPRKGSKYNVILANGRSDPGQNTGFSLQNCQITASSDFSPVKHNYDSYLGRPWKQYSRSVVMQSTIDDVISPRGWIEWPGAGSSVLKSLYYAEFANKGSGAGTSSRVTWPGFHVIGADEAIKYTVKNFIAGTSWLPSTGVTFISGLQ